MQNSTNVVRTWSYSKLCSNFFNLLLIFENRKNRLNPVAFTKILRYTKKILDVLLNTPLDTTNLSVRNDDIVKRNRVMLSIMNTLGILTPKDILCVSKDGCTTISLEDNMELIKKIYSIVENNSLFNYFKKEEGDIKYHGRRGFTSLLEKELINVTKLNAKILFTEMHRLISSQVNISLMPQDPNDKVGETHFISQLNRVDEYGLEYYKMEVVLIRLRTKKKFEIKKNEYIEQIYEKENIIIRSQKPIMGKNIFDGPNYYGLNWLIINCHKMKQSNFEFDGTFHCQVNRIVGSYYNQIQYDRMKLRTFDLEKISYMIKFTIAFTELLIIIHELTVVKINLHILNKSKSKYCAHLELLYECLNILTPYELVQFQSVKEFDSLLEPLAILFVRFKTLLKYCDVNEYIKYPMPFDRYIRWIYSLPYRQRFRKSGLLQELTQNVGSFKIYFENLDNTAKHLREFSEAYNNGSLNDDQMLLKRLECSVCYITIASKTDGLTVLHLCGHILCERCWKFFSCGRGGRDMRNENKWTFNPRFRSPDLKCPKCSKLIVFQDFLLDCPPVETSLREIGILVAELDNFPNLQENSENHNELNESVIEELEWNVIEEECRSEVEYESGYEDLDDEKQNEAYIVAFNKGPINIIEECSSEEE